MVIGHSHRYINHIGIAYPLLIPSHFRADFRQLMQCGQLQALCSGQAATDCTVRATEPGTLFLLLLIPALFGSNFQAVGVGGMPAQAGGENFAVVRVFCPLCLNRETVASLEL